MSLSTDNSAIHNIGYRRYDGPRLGRRHAAKAIYGQTLRGAFGIGRGIGGKLFPWLLASAALFPALVIVIVQASVFSDPDVDPEALVGLNHYTTFIVAVPMLFVASQAPQAFSRDLRFHTLPLYFSRQVNHHDYTNARLLGLWTAVSILLLAPLTMLYLGGLAISLPVGEWSAGFVGSAVSVLLLTAMLTVIGALIASITPRRGLGVVAVISVLLGSYTVAQFLQAMGHAFGNEQTSAWMGVFSPVSIYDGVQSFLFQGAPFNFESFMIAPTPTPAAGIFLILVALGIVFGCRQLLILRYRKVAAS
ncbi:MAG TPA: hypothetical protein H9881_17610 [Candidatus Stackebrandtia excrementipullorum]|nr:hypothetical protein [Candidatus Stackebrandtia excrementipullorum]